MKRTMIIAFAVAFVGACGAALPALDDPELADVSSKLAKCRADARGALQTGDSPEQAYAVYEACKADAGLAGAGKDGGS